MKRSISATLVLALALAAVMATILASPALAHEARTVGAYHFLVGWGEEPVYVGTRNSVQLILSKGGKPVTIPLHQLWWNC